MQEATPPTMDPLDEPTKQSQRRHRRSKKGGRNRRPEDTDPAASGPIHVRRRKSSQSREGPSAVYLRPTNVPLLNAPRNSTQFIIDDHENSNLFWNFEGGPDHNHPGMAVFPGQYFHDDDDDFSPDDDNFWTEYSVRDFQSVYDTAHQEEIAAWDKMKIIEEISTLERKQKELVDFIVRLDPELYLNRLQNQLLNLQEQNRKLRVEKEKISPAVLPDSTNTEDLEDEESRSPVVPNESSSAGVQGESSSPPGGQS